MLTPYTGEYLISPVPAHLAMNRCSHGCFYCFANLNKNDRKFDLSCIKKLLYPAKYNNLVSTLIQAGHPILLSNTTDPFCDSNADKFVAIREATRGRVRFCYQTKGGCAEAEEAALADDPTMFYISITSDDPKFLARAEPNAPSFDHRIELIRRAKSRNHHVVVGLNPLMPSWWLDFDGFIKTLKKIGVTHIWAGLLHLSQNQRDHLPSNAANKFPLEIHYTKSRQPPDFSTIRDYACRLEQEGFNVFTGGTSPGGDFWKPYFDLGYPFTPTIDGFISHLNQFPKPVAFSFNYFNHWATFCSRKGACFHEYLNSIGRTLRNNKMSDKANNFADVNSVFWDGFLVAHSPLQQKCFQVAVEYENEEMFVRIHGGHDILIFGAPENPDIVFPLNQTKTQLF